MRILKKESTAHENNSQLLLHELEEREEDGKRKDYIHFRGVRGKHEQRVTKHGYLCTQRERIAAACAAPPPPRLHHTSTTHVPCMCRAYTPCTCRAHTMHVPC